MTFIETPEQSELYAPAEAELGYVPNMVRLWANRPDVYAAWQSLNDAVRSHIELRRYELATVAAARRLRSTYCAVAHAKILADTGLSSAELIDFVDEPARVLDEVELAVTVETRGPAHRAEALAALAARGFAVRVDGAEA